MPATSSPADEKEALLTLLEETLDHDQRLVHHLVEEAREAGWSDDEILEAVAELALAEFESLISSAAELPQESSDPRSSARRRLEPCLALVRRR